jgi:DNA-binding GntR family transcriptional regulator
VTEPHRKPSFRQPLDEAPIVSTVDAIVSQLRESILAGSIAPGTPLREVELAHRYGVARNSIRPALQTLVHEGLLRHTPHKGASVPLLTGEDIRDIMSMRQALEGEAVRIAIAEDADLGVARRAVRDLTGTTERGPAIELDLAFHQALIDASKSPRMRRAYHAVESEIRLSLRQVGDAYSRPAGIARSLAKILDAIRVGDVDTAQQTLQIHLESMSPPQTATR